MKFVKLPCFLICLSVWVAGQNRLEITDRGFQVSDQSGLIVNAIQSSNSRENSPKSETVKIGLLVHSKSIDGYESVSEKQSAEMAVWEANKKGGFNGSRFELIVRSVDGAWESGSREIVALVYEDSVWAIIGVLDRRTTHLAEQIATKSQTVLVSSKATDPTLTQINIPWFFQCLPDDYLMNPGYTHSSSGKSFIEKFQGKYGHPPDVIAAYTYDSVQVIIEAIKKAGLDKEKIRDVLSSLNYSQGVTGSIRFDSSHNRITSVEY